MSENLLRRALSNDTVTERAVKEARELTTRSYSESRTLIRDLDRQIVSRDSEGRLVRKP